MQGAKGLILKSRMQLVGIWSHAAFAEGKGVNTEVKNALGPILSGAVPIPSDAAPAALQGRSHVDFGHVVRQPQIEAQQRRQLLTNLWRVCMNPPCRSLGLKFSRKLWLVLHMCTTVQGLVKSLK